MLERLKNYLLAMLQVQLVLTLTSLPILIHWGLPLSYMTFVGNILFTPVLMVFIFTSSLLFFTEICNIPNQLVVNILETITSFWQFLLTKGNISWLYGFVHPGILPLLALGLTSAVILITVFKAPLHQRIITYSLTLTIIVGSLLCYQKFIYQPQGFHTTKCSISYDKKTGVTFIDKGFFASKKSPDKAVYFDLRPFIIKRYGSIQFDKLILTKPGIRAFQGALTCCKLFAIRSVRVAYFKHKLSKKGWALFFALKNYAAQHNIRFEREYHHKKNGQKKKPNNREDRYKNLAQRYNDIPLETEEALGYPV